MEKEFLVYLAGPINGLSYQESMDWRVYAAQKFPLEIKVLSPMRGKEFLKKENTIGSISYNNPLATSKGITARDRFDVMRCDAVLMNLLDVKTVLIGTIIEIGWADAYRKPLIIAAESESTYAKHSIVSELAGFIVPTLDEAIDTVRALLIPGV